MISLISLQIPSQVMGFIFFIVIAVAVLIACRKEACSGSERRSQSKARPVTPPPPRTPEWLPSRQQVIAQTCPCGKLNSPSAEQCWSCNEPLASLQPELHTFDSARRCSVCAYYLYAGDSIVITPCCHAQGHTEHLQDWVRTKGSCPSCEESIKVTDLLRVLPPGQRPPSRLWKPSEQQIVVLVCKCGKANNPDETICWSCNESLAEAKRETQKVKAAPSCVVCGYEITPAEPIAICPNCLAQGHKTHLQAIIKAKGTCPTCGQRLRTTQLLVTKSQTTHHPRR